MVPLITIALNLRVEMQARWVYVWHGPPLELLGGGVLATSAAVRQQA